MNGALVLPLAHAGEGATWQALLTLLALGLVVVVLLVAFRVVTLEEPGDLILPLAGTAVLASLSGATSEVLSDWVGWAFPIGVVALLAVVLQGPIVRAWHPTEVGLDNALLDDLAISIEQPADGATLTTGPVEVVVEARGGTLGDGFDTTAAPPGDPEELVGLTITVVNLDTGANDSVAGDPVEDCADGCDTATYEVTIDEPGEWTIFVEAKTADVRAFTRTDGSSGTPTANVTVTVE